MAAAEAPGELAELRRCVRDLAALAALPVVWSTGNSTRVVESLAEALLGMLRLDFIYIRFRPRELAGGVEVGRLSGRPSAAKEAGSLGELLSPWLDGSRSPTELPPLPGCGAGLRGLVIPFGLDGGKGLIAGGSDRAGFPCESERLLLRVAANQASVILARHSGETHRENLLLQVEAERKRLSDVFERAPAFMCLLSGPDHVFTLANEHYRQLVGWREIQGKPVHEALPEVAGQGFIELLNGVYRTGETFVGHDMLVRLQQKSGGEPEERYVDFAYQPMRGPDGAVTGILVQGVDLTEHKRAQAELRAKDARLQLLMDNVKDYAVVITDAVGTIVEWAAGAQRITGFAAGEAIGGSVDLLFTDDDLARGQPALERRAAETSGRTEDMRWHLRKDRSRFFADGVTSPLYDDQGRLQGFGKIFRDVTTEWQARQDLARVTQESERRKRLYETILGNTPDLAYVFDLDHRFTYVNEMLLEMLGKTWDEAIGKSFLELGYEPWQAALHDTEIEQVKTSRKPVRGETPFTGTSGRRIYDYILVPVFGPDGEVEAVAGTTRDVTERKLSEEEMGRILEAEKRRAALLARVAQASRAMNAVLSVDAISRVLAEEARSIIGAHQAVASLSVDADFAQAISAVSLSDKYARYRSFDAQPTGAGIYAQVCRTNSSLRLTHDELLRHPAWRGFGQYGNDHPPLRGWLAVPLVGHGGRNLGLVQIGDRLEGDFTEEDQAILEQLAATAAVGIENARLYDSLKEQDQRKDEFLAMLAHELRNPLAPIRNGLEILRATGSRDQRVSATREMMSRQVGHMVRLIDDLMDVSRISRGKLTLKLEKVALRDVVDAAVEANRPLIDAGGHTLEVDLPESRIEVEGDLTRLAQVLGNLLNNAAKYTPDSGRISLSARREGGSAVVTVRDTGMGIAPDMLPKVFELFIQAGRSIERAQGGLGLGLALARRLVEMHGGTLDASSPGPGLGSTFTVRLPASGQADVAAQGAGEGEAGQQSRPVGTLRIMVVDDNVDAAETFGVILDLLGHQTRVAHSGPEALEIAPGFVPEVVFLDIGMPGMSGYEVVQHLRAMPNTASSTIVAVTGWGSEADRMRAQKAGFDHHLVKPVETSAAQAILHAVSSRLSSTTSSPH
jgi:PAS domain S-box-containing protein